MCVHVRGDGGMHNYVILCIRGNIVKSRTVLCTYKLLKRVESRFLHLGEYFIKYIEVNLSTDIESATFGAYLGPPPVLNHH